jgi:hypothetical protein
MKLGYPKRELTERQILKRLVIVMWIFLLSPTCNPASDVNSFQVWRVAADRFIQDRQCYFYRQGALVYTARVS